MGEIVGMCKSSSCNDRLSVINCTQWLPFLLLSQFLYSVAPHKLLKCIVSILICEVKQEIFYFRGRWWQIIAIKNDRGEGYGSRISRKLCAHRIRWPGTNSYFLSWQTPSPVKISKAPQREKSHLGRKRISISPSPVAAAAPAPSSAYAPAPGTGESPTRLCEGTAQKFRTGNQVWTP